MSWSDDTRCLYCDGKLPLYRKITSGQFCSAVHRKAYWQEQERLAVERLHQTHDSLRAYRPPEALDPPRPEPARESYSPAVSAAPLNSAADFHDGPTVEERARSASNTGQVKFAGFLVELKPHPRTGNETPLGSGLDVAAWPSHGSSLPLLSAGAIACEWAATPGTPVPFFDAAVLVSASGPAAVREWSARLLPNSLVQSAEPRIPFAALPETPEFAPEFVADLLSLEGAVVESGMVESGMLEPEMAEPETVELKPLEPEAVAAEAVEPEPVAAFSASMLLLSRIGSRAGEFAPRVTPQELLTSSSAIQTRYARISDGDWSLATPAMSAVTNLMPLMLGNTPRQQHAQLPLAKEPQAMDLSLTLDMPQIEIDLPALAPALRFAPGSRYRMGGGPGTRQGNMKAADAPRLLDLKTRDLKINDLEIHAGLRLAATCRYTVSFRPGQIERAPIRQAALNCAEVKTKIEIVPLPQGFGVSGLTPVFPRLQPLGFHAKPKTPPPAEPAAFGLAHVDPVNPPMQPVAKWEPIEGELQPPPRTGFLSNWSQAMSHIGEGKDGERKYVWSHVADFWQHAPRDLKLLSIAIPVLLGLALRPSLPKVRVTAPAAGSVVETSSLKQGLRERLQVVRRSVAERAGVELNEDFRTGLEDWKSRGDLSTAWSFDSNGFVKPGALALYRPSVGLSDYEMEFLALIDKKALSWVVRAADFDNYYVVKLVVLKPGPMPTLGITRYAVIHGKAQNRVDTVAAINARTDMLYRVNLNVQEDTFLLTLQGQVVDNWSEPRLTTGGIGFFSQQGEESRLRWVHVTHQYDMLGRLCAYLAPYNIPTTNGSW